MRDFTLVIPTYNRPHLLAALLTYLERENPDCHVLVLDSSRPELLATNRARVAASNLDTEFSEFPSLDPAEKWRQGINQVRTAFCALCADDDVVILETLQQCLDVLRNNPAAAAVQGHSFTFLPRPDGDIELNNVVYFTPTIDDPSPLERLKRLFQRYQAPSYSVFRTPTIQAAFNTLQPVTEILARELLWSALTVIEGQLIRLPNFSYGRSMGPSATYEHWHPLEWLCKDPDGLYSAYLRYRKMLTAAVANRPGNAYQIEEIHRVLDLIHLRYLANHAPDSVLQFIIEQQMEGIDFTEYWSRYELHLPLYEAAGIGTASSSSELLTVRGKERSYLLFPNFYAPLGTEPVQIPDIIRKLDNYPTVDGASPQAQTATVESYQ